MTMNIPQRRSHLADRKVSSLDKGPSSLPQLGALHLPRSWLIQIRATVLWNARILMPEAIPLPPNPRPMAMGSLHSHFLREIPVLGMLQRLQWQHQSHPYLRESHLLLR